MKTELYPTLDITYPKNPSRLWAVPLLIVFKIIAILPAEVFLGLVSIVILILSVINAAYVLLTGRYWLVAWDFNLTIAHYYVRIHSFLYGLTDKYPLFTKGWEQVFKLEFNRPTTSNRFFAFPLIGLVVRIILMIPFMVFAQLVNYAAALAVFLVAWFFVLFKGRYPETAYELAQDSIRLTLSTFFYLSGMSDNYPSFKISMNHKNLKILALVLAVLMMIGSNLGKK